MSGLAAAGILVLIPGALSGAAVSESESWRAASRDATPFQDALVIGREGDTPLYGCRALIGQDMHVGRIRPDFTGCHIGFDGRETEVKPYELLSNTWKSADASTAGALVAGTERVAGAETPFATATLLVCRAAYQGGVHSGQARVGERGCGFGYGGKLIVANAYDVLQSNPWLTWTSAGTRALPEGAVVSGIEGGELMYACRATDRTGLHPGKIKRGLVGCSIVSDGREAIVDRFEVLVARWLGGHAGTVPISAYVSGRENGNNQFVCRAQSRDSVQIGKINEALGGCHIGMQGREVVVADYEVLSQ